MLITRSITRAGNGIGNNTNNKIFISPERFKAYDLFLSEMWKKPQRDGSTLLKAIKMQYWEGGGLC